MSKRDLILKVSTRHFAEYGYEGTVLDDVAKECGLSKPAIYYHFKNKNSLYKEIICHFFTEVESQILSAIKDKEPLQALESYVRVFGEFFVREPNFSSIFAKELSAQSPNVKECATILGSILKILSSILKEGHHLRIFEEENPFVIQLMIVSTLTNYHTTKNLREHISQNMESLNLQIEPKLENIVDDLSKKIVKALICQKY